MPQYKIGDKVQINDQCYTIAGEPYLGGCADVYPLENEGIRSDFVLKVYNPKGFDDFGQTLINRDVMHGEKETTAAVGNDTFQSPVRIVAAEKNMFIETKLPNDLVSLQKLQGKFKDFTDYERVRASLYIMLSLARFLERLVELGYAHLDLSLTNVFAANINFKSDRLDAVTALVIDFGISRKLGTPVENPAWSGTEPPEYHSGNKYFVSEKTDVYGVGQLLYCLIFNASQYECGYLESNCSNLKLSQPVKDEIKNLICHLTDNSMEHRPSIGGEDRELYHALNRMVQILERRGFHQALALEKSRELYEHEWQAKFGANDDFNESLVCRPKDWDAFNTESNALLLGEGGSGKSTLFLLLWKKLLADATLLPLYIPLHAYKKEKGSFYIRSEVKRLYFPAEEECLPANFFAVNRCILLLDGLDEAEDPSGGLQEEIAILSSAAVICIASRQDYQWEATKDFKTWYLEPLPLETVMDYLEKKKVALPEEETTVQLLRFPFFLKIYSKGAKTKADILQAHVDHLLNQFKRGYPNSSRFNELRRVVKMTLPKFAFENGRTFEVKTFSDDETRIENILPTGLLIGESNGTYTRYTFVHQIYSEFFSAKYVESELQNVQHMEKDNPGKKIEIPRCLGACKLSNEILLFLGEIFGECIGKPSAIQALLHQPGFLESKCGIQATIAVRNLVECLKLSRGNELDQMNFSRLDLRLCSFVNCSLIGCCFVEAQLADGAFFNLDFPMKDISITNNGSIIVLTEVHFLLVYERHFGICVLRAKIAASDAFYVSGNLIVFAAHSGGITWFDTESLMNGQISGITYASEIKGVFLDKRGSSLAVYLDNRPNNTAKIVFYHLTKKEGEYDAVCKWTASLDTYLPQRAVPFAPEFSELDEDELLEFRGISIRDGKLLVMLQGNASLDPYFYICFAAIGENAGKIVHKAYIHEPDSGYSLYDVKFNEGKLILCYNDIPPYQLVEYDLFDGKTSPFCLGQRYANELTTVIMAGNVTAGLAYTQRGLQMAFCLGDENPFTVSFSSYVGQDVAEYVTKLALSDNGIYFAVYRPLCDANGTPFDYNASGVIEIYKLGEHSANAVIRIPISAGNVTVSAYNAKRFLVSSTNGHLAFYNGQHFNAIPPTVGERNKFFCTWIDSSRFLLCGRSCNYISMYKVNNTKCLLEEINFPEIRNCQRAENICTTQDPEYTVFVASTSTGYICIYSSDLKKMQQLALPKGVFGGGDVTSEGDYIILPVSGGPKVYKKAEDYAFAHEVKDEHGICQWDYELMGKYLLLTTGILHLRRTKLLFSLDAGYFRKTDDLRVLPKNGLQTGKQRQLTDILRKKHVCFKRKTGFIYLEENAAVNDTVKAWQVFSVLLDEENMNFIEECVGVVKTYGNDIVLNLSDCEDAFFVVEGSVMQVVHLDKPEEMPMFLVVTKTRGLSGARFSSNVDPTLKGYLEQNGAVFEE